MAATRSGPTLAACAAVLALTAWALHGVTRGFEHWTFEAQRRHDAAAGRLSAPASELRTAQGELVRLWDGRGDTAAWLVDFVYTRCPTVCSALGAEYARLQAQLLASPPAEAAATRLVSLSFDLEHDDRAALAAYARRHGADARVWQVAAPLSQAARDALLERLGVVVVPDGAGGYVHNGAIVLLDRAGTVRGVFEPAAWSQALAAARRVAAGDAVARR